MSHTRTGSFPIGFRLGGSSWQKDLDTAIAFASGHGFDHVDTPALGLDDLKKLTGAGLALGSVDLPQPWQDLATDDAAKRDAAVRACADYVRGLAEVGARNAFAVMFPADQTAPRDEAHRLAVVGWGALCEAIADTSVKIVLEGYPGGPPHYAALGCTPESLRALFRDIDSDVLGVNYDPSHLVRMGIDPVRFLGEFIDRVHHVHAKDTELLDGGLYDCGNLQRAVSFKPHRFGAHHWRYAIPGHGQVRWGKLFTMLADAGYEGRVSIELEDEDFNGSTEGEQRGLIASRDFLIGA